MNISVLKGTVQMVLLWEPHPPFCVKTGPQMRQCPKQPGQIEVTSWVPNLGLTVTRSIWPMEWSLRNSMTGFVASPSGVCPLTVCLTILSSMKFAWLRAGNFVKGCVRHVLCLWTLSKHTAMALQGLSNKVGGPSVGVTSSKVLPRFYAVMQSFGNRFVSCH